MGGEFHRRPTHSTTSTCLDSSDSFRAGAGGAAAGAADGNNDGGGANASGPDDPPASRKVWEVWASKDEMPALPRNKQFVAAMTSVSADAASELEKDGYGVNEVDTKGDDGDKEDNTGEGVRREGTLVATGTASSTAVEGVDGSEETPVDAVFSADSGGKGEDASGHMNAIEVRNTI